VVWKRQWFYAVRMTLRPDVLPVIPCGRCGAALPVDPTHPSVVCAHCRVETAVPTDLRRRAAAHAERLRTAWSEALEARIAELLHRKAAQAQPLFWRWFLVAALSAPVGLLASFSKTLSHLPHYAGILVVGVVGAIWWRFAQALFELLELPSVTLVLGSGVGECRACGGPVEIPEGAVTIDCRYCGSTVATTPEIRRDALQRAYQRVRGLVAARDQAAAAHLGGYVDARATYGIGGSISSVASGLLVVGAFVITAGTIALQQGLPRGRGETPTAWVSLAFLMIAGALGVRFVFALRRVRRAALAYRAASVSMLRRAGARGSAPSAPR
jgi:DNA-directed RNA polymerase subunit RPC12/RpoP